MTTITDEQRCWWCHGDDLYRAYHDEEWGIPSRDPHHLFEMLNLEGQQAGLSWITILRKREGYRRLFRDFDPAQIARFDDSDVERLVQDASIIRHRGKITAIIDNARAWLAMQESGQDPVEFLWDFVGGEPVINSPNELSDVPGQTEASVAMSKALKKKGFRFVGPTTCYAFMQAAGLVNDHLVGCFIHPKHVGS